jgi:hypothetical protein
MSDPAGTKTRHASGAAWGVLLSMGLTSGTYNIYHALHRGHFNLWLAIVAGVIPVLLAMLLSHIVAAYDGGWILKSITAVIMLGGMYLSMLSIGSVLAPLFGTNSYVFGAVVDGGALVALYVILNPHGRAAKEASREPGPDAFGEPLPEATQGPAPEAIEVPVPHASEGPRPRRAPRRGSDEEEKTKAAARRRYRESLKPGNSPLSDRKLGAIFGKSRTWGANRIEEVNNGPRLTGTDA